MRNKKCAKDGTCIKCKEQYTPLVDKYGRNHGCTSCDRIWKAQYMKEHPMSKSEWYKKTKETEKYKLVHWGNHLKNNYWPTLTSAQAVAEYDRMFAAQSGKCLLCDKHQSNFSKRLNVDHNHKTGQVRGLLCWRCNQHIVGRHTLESVSKLAKYLEVERGYIGK